MLIYELNFAASLVQQRVEKTLKYTSATSGLLVGLDWFLQSKNQLEVRLMLYFVFVVHYILYLLLHYIYLTGVVTNYFTK